MVARDIALAAAAGAPVHFLHLSTAALGRARAAREGRRRRGDRGGGAAPLHAHRRPDRRRLRPGVQGEPAAADPGRRGRGSGQAWPTARSTRSRPTTRPTRPNERTCPSTRRRRGCSASRPPSPSSLGELGAADRAGPRAAQLAARRARWARPGQRRRAGRPDRRAADRGQPVRHRPGGHLDGRPGGTRKPEPQHALRREAPDRTSTPHRPARRTGRRRRGGAAVSDGILGTPPQTRRSSSSRTARSSRARRSARFGADGVATGEARLQHGALRLPGGDHRPLLRGAGGRRSPIPTSETTASTRPTTRRRARTARASSSATSSERPSNWRSTESLEELPRAPLGPRHDRASTPAGSPGTCATAVRCPAPSAPRPRRRSQTPRPPRRRRPTASTWCAV